MNAPRFAMVILIAAAAVAGLLGMAVAFADTATSPDSAWVALPDDLEPDLTDPLLRQGQSVYINRCAGCHSEIPQDTFGPLFLPPMPGTQVLRERYRGALPAELHRRTDLPAAYIEVVVRQGLGSMPFFRPTELTDQDLQALVAYLTRARSETP